MKKIILAIVAIIIVTISCNKENKVTTSTLSTVKVPAIKHVRKEKPKCNLDLIIHPGPPGGDGGFNCESIGNNCYHNKKGDHKCGMYTAEVDIVTDYTNLDGSINTIDYVSNEDYSAIFDDIAQNVDLYNQVMDGTLHLYVVNWPDGTYLEESEQCDCVSTIYVLSSASSVSTLSPSNVTLIWIL